MIIPTLFKQVLWNHFVVTSQQRDLKILKYYDIKKNLPVWTSQIMSVWSPAPDMKCFVSQSTSMAHTTPWCPSYVPSRSPLTAYLSLKQADINHQTSNQLAMKIQAVYQTQGWVSLAEEKSRSPSRLYLIWVMERSCPWSIKGFYRRYKKTALKNIKKGE